MNNKNGFTLLEILIVVVIIGIISTFLFPYISNSLKDARLSKVKQDFSAIKDIVQAHYLSKTDIQGEYIAPLEEDSLIILDYFHDNGDFADKTTQERFHAVHALEYLKNTKSISVPTDPWGREYSILVRSQTLPDSIDIDFSEPLIYITKVFQLDRAKVSDLYIGKKAHSYDLIQPVPPGVGSPPTEKDALSFEFLYRYYYTSPKVSPYPTLGDMVFKMIKPMLEDSQEIILTPNNLGSPDDSKRYATWKKAHLTIPNVSINDIQDYSSYFSISIPSGLLNNPNETRLEITGLLMRARVVHSMATITGFTGPTSLPVWSVDPSVAGWKDFYHSPFNGKVELTVISAGPDTVFNTYDDLSSDYSIKLNF